MDLTAIRELCYQRNITYAQLERELDLGNGIISGWARHKPRYNGVRKVADYFGCTVDEIAPGVFAKGESIQ